MTTKEEMWLWFGGMVACLVMGWGVITLLLWWMSKVWDGRNGRPMCHLGFLVVWFGLKASLWVYVCLCLMGLAVLIWASRMTEKDKAMMKRMEGDGLLEPEEDCDLNYYQIRAGRCPNAEVRNGRVYCKKCDRNY